PKADLVIGGFRPKRATVLGRAPAFQAPGRFRLGLDLREAQFNLSETVEPLVVGKLGHGRAGQSRQILVLGPGDVLERAPTARVVLAAWGDGAGGDKLVDSDGGATPRCYGLNHGGGTGDAVASGEDLGL